MRGGQRDAGRDRAWAAVGVGRVPRVTARSGTAARLGPIDHVAVVVRSIEESAPRYRELFGLEPTGSPIELANQAVRVVFLASGPEPSARIELIQPTDEQSGVARF